MLKMTIKLFIKLFCINCILIQINALPVQDEKQVTIRSDAEAITSEKKNQGDVNINIRFETGPGNVFAHFSSSQFGGNAPFEDQTTKTFDKDKTENSGISQIQAPTPELGTSSDLSHSEQNQEKNGCILKTKAPISLVYQPTFVLHLDDIRSISALHGPRDQNSQKPANPSSDVPDLCKNASIDTITAIPSGDIYVFKGDFYWKVTDSFKLADGYPRRISDDWNGLEGNLDASITWKNKTFFFKEGRYWNFTNKNMNRGYPQPMNEIFRGIPRNLEAALTYNIWNAGMMYFFKGDKYWALHNESATSNTSYTLRNWGHVPDNIDAALTWGKHTYFFKGDHYYRYQSTKHESGPDYPLSTAEYWFGCNADGAKGQIP